MTMTTTAKPFSHLDIDDVIHGRIRLGVMAYLSTVSPVVFGDLRDKVEATDGNLSTHLRKLEEAGYVQQEKRFEGRRPQTLVHLSDEGREAWLAWVERMQLLIGGGVEPT